MRALALSLALGVPAPAVAGTADLELYGCGACVAVLEQGEPCERYGLCGVLNPKVCARAGV